MLWLGAEDNLFINAARIDSLEALVFTHRNLSTHWIVNAVQGDASATLYRGSEEGAQRHIMKIIDATKNTRTHVGGGLAVDSGTTVFVPYQDDRAKEDKKS
jgi:hypothetical protein